MILVVTAYCESDAERCVRLYNWIGKLGGIKNRVLFVTDRTTKHATIQAVCAAAKPVCVGYETILIDPCPMGHKWPLGANWAFMQAAKKVHTAYKVPFLWLEPDCAPTKKGWLEALDKEYAEAGKTYMGSMMTNKPPLPVRGMWGIAVYHHDVYGVFMAKSARKINIAFDVTMADTLVPQAHDTKLIQCINGPGRVPQRVKPEHIQPETVLLHQDKFGDVRRIVEEHEQHSFRNDLTVVITTHNRIAKLRDAYRSCLDAGVKHIVITETGYGADVMWSEFPKSAIIKNETDESNKAWLAGVREAKTKWCHILHDDDLLMPDFFKHTEEVKHDSFILMNARYHLDIGTTNAICAGPYTSEGAQDTGMLREFLLNNSNLAISPVRGVFKTSDLIRWLSEAGERLPKSCEYRPGFLVGNDLWIYLCAANTYSSFYSIMQCPVSLGSWDQSTTINAIAEDKAFKLLSIYNEARKVFTEKPKQIEVVSYILLHLLTIVRDGAPFLVGQLQCFNRLRIPWQWSIVHGDAIPNHCTAWCKRLPHGMPTDGTEALLRDLEHHKHIKIVNRAEWDGKVAMVNSALEDRQEVLVEVDCDEFWEAKQLEAIREMFIKEPRSHAMFWCRYFVGPGMVMNDRNCYANNPAQEWRRAWFRKPEQRFLTHEPPVMSGDQSSFFSHAETEALGLVFDHYSYVLKSQLAFKEVYYGYTDAVKCWERLQKVVTKTTLSEFFPWAKQGGSVEPI